MLMFRKLALGYVVAAMAAAGAFAAGTLPAGYTEIEYIHEPQQFERWKFAA